jgi:hypothetical protein
MLVLACGLLAVVSPALVGGDLRRLGLVRFRLVWLPVLALVAQIVIIEVVPDAPAALLEGIHMGTYVAAAAFIAANWRVPGLLVVAVGGLLNGVTIALNNGTLPASIDALRAAGLPFSDGEFINSGVLADPVMPLLGDIFAWPAPLPLANVYSFGDVVIVLGVAYASHKITGSRLVRKPWVPAGLDDVADTRGVRPEGAPEGPVAARAADPAAPVATPFTSRQTPPPPPQRLPAPRLDGSVGPDGGTSRLT